MIYSNKFRILLFLSFSYNDNDITFVEQINAKSYEHCSALGSFFGEAIKKCYVFGEEALRYYYIFENYYVRESFTIVSQKEESFF